MLPVDFTNYRDVQIVVDNLQTFVKRKVPLRFGLAPQTSTTQSAEQAKVVYHLLDTYGLSTTMEYLEKVSQNNDLELNMVVADFHSRY